MTSVGVREFRRRTGALLRLVEAGETIEITDRGRPVALLGPVPAHGTTAHLHATGDFTGPSGDLDDLPAPLKVPPGDPSPTGVLGDLRRNER